MESRSRSEWISVIVDTHSPHNMEALATEILATEILLAIADARSRAIEEVIKLVCECCADGSAVRPSEVIDGVMVHDLSDGSVMVCPADSIRAPLPSAGAKAGEE